MVDAVRCVIEVQIAVAEKTAGIPADQRIACRVGVNIGDIIIDGDDIFALVCAWRGRPSDRAPFGRDLSS